MYPTHYLAWDDCTFWLHPGRHGNVLTGIVRFNWLKGKRQDPNDYKEISLRLLPVPLAFEDSLRQLMILALAEGIMDGIESWDDLERLQGSCKVFRSNE